MKHLLTVALICFVSSIAFCQIKITAQESSKHINDSVTVKDKVYGVKVFDDGMTLINLGGKFPNHLMVIMIPANKAPLFKTKTLLNSVNIEVTGKIVEYKGMPEIIITDPKQLVATYLSD